MKKRQRQEQASYDDLLSAYDGDVVAPDATIVMSITSGKCRVFDGVREIECIVPSAMAKRQKSALAVGDRVQIDEESGAVRIAGVMPRRSVLARPDPLNPHMQRLIAANIDVVAHVVTFKSPPLRPRLIDRYLIAIQRGRADPLLCVNKIDLLDDEERAAQLRGLDPYRALGVRIIVCSTKSGEGLDDLRAALDGKLAALVGHSGVGKSSILNALDARLNIAIGGMLARGTGRHTTTSSTLHDLGNHTYVIDTPGIREFGLWDLDRESLRDYFPEFEEPAEECRFNDCIHIHEPECEVKRRVESGELSAARYDAYVRLYESMEEKSY